jgi:hypothetical protein
MPRPYQNIEVERFTIAFAQTISWMPPGDGVNVLFDGRSVNFHYNDPTGAPTALFHGVPTADQEWQKLDLWSITTGNNDGYDYTLSDSSVYEVLRHGFKINRKGYHRVTCALGLEVYLSSNRYNVAIQLAKKPALSATWTRVGAPVMSGYINLHSSGADASRSVSVSHIIDFDPADEVAVFTTGIGVQGNVYAIKKHCILRIESLN